MIGKPTYTEVKKDWCIANKLCILLLFYSCPVSSVRKYRKTLEAFSEDHLKTFYFNPLLEQMEGFVEHFIRVNKFINQTIQLPL